MTKPVVASAALILSAQGKLRLDDPVSRHVRAFSQGRSQEIKVRNLANHTSGFRIPTNFIAKTNAEIPDGSTLQRELPVFRKSVPLRLPAPRTTTATLATTRLRLLLKWLPVRRLIVFCPILFSSRSE